MNTAAAAPARMASRQRGASFWLHSFALMVEWNVTRMRLVLPGLALVQVFTSVGLVLGMSLLFEYIAPRQALYLGTGAVAISMVMVGVITGPQVIAEQRLSGSADWLASLPVPRSASAAAATVFNIVVAIPGATAALLAAWIRFDVGLALNPQLVPGVLLVLVCGSLIGYAYAHLLSDAKIVALVAQVLVFIVIGFSPMAYPPANLPGWLATAHTFLPFVHMADVIRAGLTNGLVDNVALSYLVLAAWTAVAAAGATWALGRRS
jgi:ABC-2 type transport system permease protein